ncbi:CheR family methyltransferase [Alicyclobacillus ferrooxydans]|uniref:CheR family methyltransferase n=1 Tax=Alicyclobacillus ferrooxydans TaxID=471514 RepID=UPI001B809C5C
MQDFQSDIDFVEFARQLKQKTGVDLLSYKQGQVLRRLTSLRERKGFHSFAAFYRAMERDKELYDAFIDQLTINVTEFYRNPGRWEVLRRQILPEILRSGLSRIKCWSAACSTGDEPYSIVLTVSDFLPLQNIEVHATDIDSAVIDKAKIGKYAASAVREVPQDKLSKYFSMDNDGYRIAEAIKGRVRFRQHDLLTDPYESGYDLIVCRNVVIYFTDEAKTRIYHKFSKSLKPGGYLFVGGVEQISNPADYGLESTAMFFYKKL